MLSETILKLSEKFGSIKTLDYYVKYLDKYTTKHKNSNLCSYMFDNKMFKTFDRYTKGYYLK